MLSYGSRRTPARPRHLRWNPGFAALKSIVNSPACRRDSTRSRPHRPASGGQRKAHPPRCGHLGRREDGPCAGQCEKAGVPIAAICGATLPLARGGLDDRKRTSNDPRFLQSSGYAAAAPYPSERVGEDRGVITASGTALLELARMIRERLEAFPPSAPDAWYGFYSTGEPSSISPS